MGNTTQIIKYALNIEDLSSQDELKPFYLKDVWLDGMMTEYSFPIKRENFPPNFEEMSLCLVPMEKYIDGMFNMEDESIYAQVEKVQNFRIYFQKKFPFNRQGIRQSLNVDEKYFIRFVPNRITYRACFQALDSINLKLLTRYFDAFDDEPVKSKKDNGQIIEDFEWFNKKIETNEE